MRYKVEMFKDKQRSWHMRLKATNGRIIMSSEAYSSKTMCSKTARQIRGNIERKIREVEK